MDVREAVYFRLSTSAAITALVGGRIYFGDLPQTARYPALSYVVVRRPYGHNLIGADGTSEAYVRISAWSYSEAIADQLTQAVRDLFDGFSGVIGDLVVTASLNQDETDYPEPPKAGTDQWIYRIDADYKISHRISLPASLGAQRSLLSFALPTPLHARLEAKTPRA